MPSNSTDHRPPMQLVAHPAANIFPAIDGEEFRKLRADIADHGQREPIVLLDSQILDGLNRYRACIDLGIEPSTVELDSCDDPVAFVLSANLHRRHLTKSQASAIAAEHLPRFVTEAKARLSAAQKSGGRGHKKTPPQYCGGVSQAGEAVEIAAKLVGVSPTYVREAGRIKEQSPEIYDKVKAGELTIPEAKRKLSETPAPSSLRVDGNGANIPVKMQPVFYSRKRFSGAITSIGHLLTEVNNLAESQAGTFLAERLSEIQTDLKNAQRAIKFASPHQICPYCKGKGCEPTAGKKAPCRGTGWTIRGVKGPGE